MANQRTIQRVLAEAHAQNLIFPSSTSNPCLLGIINTANNCLYLLEQSQGQGLDNEQLVTRSNLNLNTVKVYMRALASLGYISRTELNNDRGQGAHKVVWAIEE